MTYDDLKNELSQLLRLEDLELHNYVGNMVRNAEAWMSRRLNTLDMEAEQIYPIGTTGIYDLPEDWKGHRLVQRVGDEIRALYWQRIPALSALNPTNWVLDKHPDLYLYASLYQAKSLLPADDVRPDQMWLPQAQAIIAEVEIEDDLAKYSGSPLAIRRVSESSEADGAYEYLTPYSFTAKADMESACPGERFFTVTQDKLRIYPVPGA